MSQSFLSCCLGISVVLIIRVTSLWEQPTHTTVKTKTLANPYLYLDKSMKKSKKQQLHRITQSQ